MKKVTLIANSGLQFCTTTMTIDPTAKLQLPDSKGRQTTLQYFFFEGKEKNANYEYCLSFNLCIPAQLPGEGRVYIPFLAENVDMINQYPDKYLLKDTDGNWVIAPDGLPQLNPDVPIGSLKYRKEVYSIDSLDTDGYFNKLLGQWLPMPMYEIGENGITSAYPHGWCRVRIDAIGEKKEVNDDYDEEVSKKTYRLTWAFDTKLAKNNKYKLRPYFLNGTQEKKFGLCNKTDLLFGRNKFITIPDGSESPVGNYLVEKLGIKFNPSFDNQQKPKKDPDYDYEDEKPKPQIYSFCKFLGFYTFLINYLRLTPDAVPEVTLYNCVDTSTEIPVDMSIDIGNSRTCVTLYVDADEKKEDLFSNATMLELRDLTEPWRNEYMDDDKSKEKGKDKTFDTRFVFRKADLGNNIHFHNIDPTGNQEQEEEYEADLFKWPSFVRVGEEAHRLICLGQRDGDSNYKTYYSSPKRYLWDDAKFKNVWRNLVLEDTDQKKPFIAGLSEKISLRGKYSSKGAPDYKADSDCKYSRRCMMTFVMIEIFQQAFCYINSWKFRQMYGSSEQFRRCLRRVVVTCPTAMPIEEQIVLRRAAENAKKVLMDCYYPKTSDPDGSIKIDTKKLKTKIEIVPDYHAYEEGGDPEDRDWQYDEALANQFVYLYAELQDKYQGNVSDFLRLRGHVREECDENGKPIFNGSALTIGSIDIGAGTTDVMVAAYGFKGSASLTPMPLYYDTFYKAGDDIMYKLIKEVVIEDLGDNGNDKTVYDETYGSVGRSVKMRIGKMSDEDLSALHAVKQDSELANIVSSIAEKRRILETLDSRRRKNIEDEIKKKIDFLAGELLMRFFGKNIASVYVAERNYRVDFCNQVSIPLAQFFLGLLRNNEPSQDFTYDKIFTEYKPDDDLLNYFESCFGFRFEDLKWHYDKDRIAEKVRSEMDDLFDKISMVLYARHCDILILSGRPTGLKPLTDLLMRYLPVAPHRMVTLEDYNVGSWYPFSFAKGDFKRSQKALVSVGAEIGFLASHGGFGGLYLDFSELKALKSTVKYLGFIKDSRIENPFITPKRGDSTEENVHGNSILIGCKQYNVPKYIARPLYVIENNSGGSINLDFHRDYENYPEKLDIENIVSSQNGEDVSYKVKIRLKTMTEDDFWMDNGAFHLT